MKFALLVILFFVPLFLIPSATGGAFSGIQQLEEVNKIQKVIESSYEIEAKAGRDFDTMMFDKIYANDIRGGELSQSTVEFIESVFRDQGEDRYGYLDYKLAYFAWWRKGALKAETIFMKVKKENRKMTKDDVRSLFDEKGRLAMPRLKGDIVKKNLAFNSIEVNTDTAVVVFNDGSRTNQMTLVKIDNNWLIAGNKIIAVHP
jgi:hypothetical protein